MDVSLRPLTAEDMPDLTLGGSEYVDFGPRPVTDVPGASLAVDRDRLAVIADDELVGFVNWHWGDMWGPNAESRSPNLGIWLMSSARGRGVGSRAQRHLAQLFFLHTGVNRVDALTDVENIAEQRALERAGFTREGVMRGAQFRLGAYHDLVYYAVLRADLS